MTTCRYPHSGANRLATRAISLLRGLLPALLLGLWTGVFLFGFGHQAKRDPAPGACLAAPSTQGMLLAMMAAQEEADGEDAEEEGDTEAGEDKEDEGVEEEKKAPPAWMYKGRVVAPEYLTDPVEVNPPTMKERTIAPVISVKLVRYGNRLLERYDENADGKLQKEEWTKMQGAPQTIDFDGDFVLTVQEIVRHVALYGMHRSIYHPYVAQTRTRPDRSRETRMQLFHPASGTLEEEEEATETEEGSTPLEDVTSEELEEGEVFGESKEEGEEASEGEEEGEEEKSEEIRKAEEEALRKALGELAPAAARKYYTSPAKLRGLPTWFVTRDANGDGQVELHEFAPSLSTPAVAQFGRLDKNGDGVLTAEELTSGN